MVISIPTITPHQKEIILHPAQFRILTAGRRFGKAITTRADLINRLPLPNKQYWYIAQMGGRVHEEYEWFLKQKFTRRLLRNKGKQPEAHAPREKGGDRPFAGQ